MRIIGCDLHSRQQALAMLDTATGEVVKKTLKHEGNNVRELYSTLPGPVRVGIEATQGVARSTGIVAAPSSVGTHTDANPKCAASYSLGEWSATRTCPVDSSRATGDRHQRVMVRKSPAD